MGVSVIGHTSSQVWKLLGIDLDQEKEAQNKELVNEAKEDSGKEVGKDEKEITKQVEKDIERLKRD